MRLNTHSATLAAATRPVSVVVRLLQLRHLREVEARAEHDDQHQRDHEVDRRPRQRHEDFLARLLRHALQRRQTADRQQRDVRRADAVAARGKHMPELVQQHAREQQRR